MESRIYFHAPFYGMENTVLLVFKAVFLCAKMENKADANAEKQKRRKEKKFLAGSGKKGLSGGKEKHLPCYMRYNGSRILGCIFYRNRRIKDGKICLHTGFYKRAKP